MGPMQGWHSNIWRFPYQKVKNEKERETETMREYLIFNVYILLGIIITIEKSQDKII